MDETKPAILPEDPQASGEETPRAPGAADVKERPAAIPEAGETPQRDEWATVRRLARKQLDRFMSFQPKVLRGNDPDAIHDMRVASRRLQQTLDLLYPKPRRGEIRDMRRRLRRSRRCLSEVRNCDVMIEHARQRLARKRTARREVWVALLHYLRERRQASFDKATRKLGKANLTVFYVCLKDHLSLPGEQPAGGGARGRSFPELTAEQFYERASATLDRTSRAFSAQLQLAHRDPRAAVIHGARISTKRLRYLVEVIGEFGVLGTQPQLAWLRSLQTLLGDWHDMEVLEEMMISMVARPEFLRDHLELAMTVEKQIERNRAEKRLLQEKFFKMTLDAPEVQRLSEWVAYLLESPSEAFATA